MNTLENTIPKIEAINFTWGYVLKIRFLLLFLCCDQLVTHKQTNREVEKYPHL